MKILDRLKRDGYHTSVIASYSCDLPFYEGIVQSTLRAYGCLNNFLLVDVNTYSRSLPTLGNLAMDAGRLYSVVPISTRGAFHPKIILQLGEKKGRLFLGSANASVDGFGSNREMMIEIACTTEPSPEQALISQAYDYLLPFIKTNTPSGSYKLTTLLQDTPWLESVQRPGGPIDLPEGEQVSLIIGPETKIASRYIDFIGEDKIKRLIALAPFWDSKLSALTHLMTALKPLDTALIVQSETVNFKWQALENLPGAASIHEPKWSDSKDRLRYMHAKLFIAEGEKFDYLLMGSANCSFAAMGNDKVTGLNAEACIFRRVPAGTAYSHLSIPCELTKDSALEKAAIENLGYKEDDASPGEGLPFPGQLEILGDKIILSASDHLKKPVTSLHLLDAFFEKLTTLPVDKQELGKIVFSGAKGIKTTIRFGQVQMEDDSLSKPVILHFNDALRRAAPGKAGAKLNTIFERVRLGESSFLAMLEPFQRIFFNTAEKDTDTTKTKTKQPPKPDETDNTSDETPSETTSTMPYEDFISRRQAPIKVDETLIHTAGTEAAIFIDFLRKRFSSQVDADTLVDAYEKEEALEDELDDVVTKQPPKASKPAPEVKPTESIAIERERNNASKLVKNYVKWADHNIGNSVDETTSEDIAGLWGLLSIICHLTFISFPVDNDKGRDTIFTVSDLSSVLYFPKAIANVIGHFFFNGRSPLIDRINIPEDSKELPSEYFGAWTMCYWALCISMQIAMSQEDQQTAEDIESLAYIVYRKTGLTTESLDANEIQERLIKIHEMIVPSGQGPFIAQVRKWHDWFIDQSKEERASANVITEPLEVGDRVWPPVGGPRYIRGIENNKVTLNFPGISNSAEKSYCYQLLTRSLIKIHVADYSTP